MMNLALEVFQFAPRFADPAANLERIGQRAAQSAADVLLTPELSITGYDLGDDAALLAVPVEPNAAFAGLDGEIRPHVVVGLCERAGEGLTCNTLVAVHRGRVQHRHRKVYLPTYGMFDEGRFFARGREIRPWHLGPWRIAPLICEDFWHPGLAYAYACAGAQLLLVAAAAPGRGVWQGGENGRFASAGTWERIARTTAQLYGMYVALCNRVGIEGSITFAGGSLIVGPDGEVLARAGDGEETSLQAVLSLDEVARCRRPYAHQRDEDARMVLAALQQTVTP
jgi:predicted amidohydrolase